MVGGWGVGSPVMHHTPGGAGETNRARFIKQRELLGGMGNAGC